MKKINLLIVIFSLILFSDVRGQKAYYFQYNLYDSLPPTPVTLTEYHEWIKGEQYSLFTDEPSQEEITTEIVERDERGLPSRFKMDLTSKIKDHRFPIYRNSKKNYLLRTTIAPTGFLTEPKSIVMLEEMYSFDWVITGEQKYIDSLLCLRATTEFRCMEFEVWYSPDIPISSGPFFLHGLPGLIIEASFYGGMKTYKLEHFGKLEKPMLNMKNLGFKQLNYNQLPHHCDLKEDFEDYLAIIKAQFGGPDCTNCDMILHNLSWPECWDDCE